MQLHNFGNVQQILSISVQRKKNAEISKKLDLEVEVVMELDWNMMSLKVEKDKFITLLIRQIAEASENCDQDISF